MNSPKRVNKLVIRNLTHPTGYMTVRRNATPEQKKNTEYITRFQTAGFEDRLTPEVLTGISLGNLKGEVRERYLEAFSRSSASGMLNYYRAAGPLPKADAPQEFPRLSMPVSQFHGLRDKAVDMDGLRDTWNWIDADYTLVTVPESDHWVQRDAAGLVSETMRWWLQSRR
ncbi:MAG: alpha/beta fold hydrolase [Isosphaeraceae bacterium]